jgi:predicted AAA+ superfamily ATPase
VLQETESSNTKLLTRNIEPVALETLADTPVLIIQGARQVGKSTLASMLANKLEKSRQLTLDDPGVLLAAKSDPVGFINQFPEGTLLIDEVQLLPQLLRAVKLIVDQNRQPGRFILTGSADLLHTSGANESLVGRAETISLYPFSQGELVGSRDDFVTRLIDGIPTESFRKADALSREDYARIVSTGGYPDALSRSPRRRKAYFRNYLSGVFDHDAIGLSGLAHLDKLGTVFSIVSAQTSGELVLVNLARQVQIPETSIRAYIRLLKDLCLVAELPAWGRNVTNRSVSRSKLSLIDTGLASYLNGESTESLAAITHGFALGHLLESFVVSELLKQQTWSETDYSLFHYRDREKREVDIIIELFDGRLIALEVKATRSLTAKDFKGIEHIRSMTGDDFLGGFVLYAGTEHLSFGDRIYSMPLSSLWHFAGTKPV